MVAAVLTALVVLAAAAGFGRGILRMARIEVRPNEGVFSAVALGLGALSLVIFVAGVAGAFDRLFVCGILLAVLALFPRDVLWSARSLAKTVKRLLAARRGVFEWLLLVALAGAVTVNFICCLAPPTETDSLTLHLVLPREYINAGRMVYLGDNWESALSLGPHMLYTLVILVSRGYLAPAVLHFLVGVVFILAVWQFARLRFGASAAYIAAAVLYTIPMVTHLTIAPMIDMFFAIYTLCSLVWLMRFLEKQATSAIIAAGVFAAFSANVKYTGLVIMASVIGTAFVCVISKKRPALLAAITVAALVSAVVSSPFLIRNYMWTGNPVFPSSKKVFGGPGWDKPRWQDARYGDARYEALHHSVKNMFLAPWLITTDAETASGGISETVGPAFLVFLPLVVLMRSRRRLFARLGLYVLVVFVLTYWLSPRPRGRYFLSIMPVLAVFVGAGSALLGKYSRWGFRVGRAVILLSVFSGLGITLVYSASFVKVVFGITSREAFLTRSTDFYPDYRWMKQNLPRGSKVLVEATNDLHYLGVPVMRLGISSGYTLADSRDFFGLGATGSVRTALRKLKAHQITHVFTGEEFVAESSQSSAGRILHQMEQSGYLEKIRSADSARGTRNPLAAQRRQRVAVYRVAYDGKGSR